MPKFNDFDLDLQTVQGNFPPGSHTSLICPPVYPAHSYNDTKCCPYSYCCLATPNYCVPATHAEACILTQTCPEPVITMRIC